MEANKFTTDQRRESGLFSVKKKKKSGTQTCCKCDTPAETWL